MTFYGSYGEYSIGKFLVLLGILCVILFIMYFYKHKKRGK